MYKIHVRVHVHMCLKLELLTFLVFLLSVLLIEVYSLDNLLSVSHPNNASNNL